MANAPVGAAQYLARFGEQRINCNQYALAKLGVDRSHCSLKIEDYMILCIPFQFGFKRSLLMASLSKQELAFFQKYVNAIANLSISFQLPGRSEPLNFFIRCTIVQVGQMKGRDNVSIFVVDFKLAPDELVRILGGFLEFQDNLRLMYEDYGKKPVKISPETAKTMGYNMFASIADGTQDGKRIQLVNISSKMIEFLEAAGSPVRPAGTELNYHLFFKKYRVFASGKIEASGTLPQGIVRTTSNLDFNPELVEIIGDYWHQVHSGYGGA